MLYEVITLVVDHRSYKPYLLALGTRNRLGGQDHLGRLGQPDVTDKLMV